MTDQRKAPPPDEDFAAMFAASERGGKQARRPTFAIGDRVSGKVVSAHAQTVRHCHIREGDDGVLFNADADAPFTYKDACVEFDPHVGGNPATAEQARKAVSDFLTALFKLG